MTESLWLQGLVTIGVGAVSGGITNAVAVWMLFHPHRPWGFGPLKIQGAIPKNQARLAKSIGRTVGERLLSVEDLSRHLGSPALRAAFDGAVADAVDGLLNRPRGSLREELPRPVVAELERALEPIAVELARRVALLVETPEFAEALDRYVTLDRWVADGLASAELEAAVRRFIAAQRAGLLRDERPLLDRLPAGLLAALEQAVTDYLPVAVEQLGRALADPASRDRIRAAVKTVLDRALANLKTHERVMAKLVITSDRLDRMLEGLEGGGVEELAAAFQSPEFKARLSSAVNDAVVGFLRAPIAERLWALGPDRLDGLERAAADYIVAALRAPETRYWAVARARDAVALARRALAADSGRARLATTAHAAVRALLDLPIGRPADLLPDDAESRLAAALTDPLWEWIQGRVPAVVAELSVAEQVEQKLLTLPLGRMEELIRSVSEKELRLIVQLGYWLGALVGAIAWGLNLLVR